MQAIVAVTSNAAECSRVGQLLGSIANGKRADIIAVEGDPLADIKVLQDSARLRLIMKDGAAYKNELRSAVPA
jgi:imidazolonepropionase-like amidohydrolase